VADTGRWHTRSFSLLDEHIEWLEREVIRLRQLAPRGARLATINMSSVIRLLIAEEMARREEESDA
jgi:hypothetical protein